MLRIPPAEHLDDLHFAVADALAAFGKQRGALKKQLAPANWFWTHATAASQLHWL